ncbi:hypothetical protein CEE39_00775 [bacterium (candidate division B38) B3_B38]|nr:MAG: hypothetical protein CEE39_00775 [bacterium (candidate division B38) B3_B38]
MLILLIIKMPSHCILLLIKNKFVVTLNPLNSKEAVKREIGFNGAIASMKSLIAILSISIVLLCYGDDLSPQEKKDDKRLEISGYFGTGGQATEGGQGSAFDVLGFGVGLEYFLTSRMSIEW